MKILDLICPQTIKCAICKKESPTYSICDNCYSKLPWIKGDTCERCGGVVYGTGKVCNDCKGGEFYFIKNFSIFSYIDDVQKLILTFKSGKKYLSGCFDEIIRKYIKNLKVDFDIIIPIPIHISRQKERGFNQSEVLLEDLKEDYIVDATIMTRVKNTPHQTGLNKENRMTNLDKAFTINDATKIKDKVILLFDDIYTTGSTINEASKTLVNNGAKAVYSLCLARTPVSKFLDEE